MKVLGIDIGFGHTKVVYDGGKLKFPSWLSYWTITGIGDIKPVEYDGSRFVVGERARLSGKRIELASIDELIKYYPVFIRYVLDTLGLQAKEVLVITGLPPRYMERAEELKKDKLGVKRQVVFQGFGIFWDSRERAGEDGLVVDIGYNTVDYFAYSVRGGELIKEVVGTIPNMGVINAVGMFRDLLPAKHEPLKTKPLSSLVNIFVEGKFRGEDFSSVKEKAVEQWNEMVKARLRQEVGVLFEEKEHLLVAGGGAYLVRKDVFPQEVIIPDEPEFANARGYYRLGKGD